jgi:hypothetical protein
MQLEFTLNETWLIDFACKDADGVALSLAGGALGFKVGAPAILSLSSPSTGIVISNADLGLATISVTPAAQAAAGLAAGVYPFEIRATLSDTNVTTQAEGSLVVLPTLFV